MLSKNDNKKSNYKVAFTVLAQLSKEKIEKIKQSVY